TLSPDRESPSPTRAAARWKSRRPGVVAGFRENGRATGAAGRLRPRPESARRFPFSTESTGKTSMLRSRTMDPRQPKAVLTRRIAAGETIALATMKPRLVQPRNSRRLVRQAHHRRRDFLALLDRPLG